LSILLFLHMVSCARKMTSQNLERIFQQSVFPLFTLLTILSVFGLLLVAPARADAEAINVDISPELDSVRPLEDLVNIKIAVATERQGPVDLSLQLWAPPRGSIFTTDFPLLEGTKLLEMDVRLPDGRLDWSYAFPIRGTYRLELRAVDAEGSSVARTVLLQVSENWTKWGFLLGFFAVLFALGLVAGRLFSSRPALNACLLVMILGMVALAHAGQASEELKSELFVSPSRVGSSSTIRWSMADQRLPGAQDALLTMSITQLEKERTLFRLNALPIRGDFEFGYEFTDASDHLVDATVVLTGDGERVRARKRVQVTSPDPSLADRLRPVLASLLVVTAGLITGRLSRKRTGRNNVASQGRAQKGMQLNDRSL
jgi:hypothetical protein